MNTKPADNSSEGMLCRSARLLIPLSITVSSGVRVVDLSLYPPIRHTAHLQTKRTSRQVFFVNSRATTGASAAGPLCSCGGPGDTGDGIYDDGEWLCEGCIAGSLREQTLSELFSKENDTSFRIELQT